MAQCVTNKLILGTAQLGSACSVTRQRIKPTFADAFTIIETALSQGITTFDTATKYGDAEDRLGQAFCLLGTETIPHIITKLAPSALSSPQICVKELRQTLERLRVKTLYALLTNSFDEIHRPTVGTAFNEIKQRGLAKFTGASVSTASEAIRCMTLPWVDIVQMPLNAFDMQADTKDLFNYARQCGKQ